MGELLRGWALQRVLQLHQRLGGEEGQAPPEADLSKFCNAMG
jgi:hypothetical protein